MPSWAETCCRQWEREEAAGCTCRNRRPYAPGCPIHDPDEWAEVDLDDEGTPL